MGVVDHLGFQFVYKGISNSWGGSLGSPSCITEVDFMYSPDDPMELQGLHLMIQGASSPLQSDAVPSTFAAESCFRLVLGAPVLLRESPASLPKKVATTHNQFVHTSGSHQPNPGSPIS